MKQLEMFNIPMVTIWYESRAGRRKGLVVHTAVVYDEGGDPIIGVEIETRYKRGMRTRTIEAAKEAWVLRKVRPHGDEYTKGEVHVYYLYEL